MARERSFPISPKGSKAPKSSDLRGQAKFKMLTNDGRLEILTVTESFIQTHCRATTLKWVIITWE